MRLADVGEHALVARLVARLSGTGGDLADLQDDAAVVRVGDTHLVASTDTLTAATHFPPQATPDDMGWMVAAVNLSDVAAMGADPLGVLVAVGAPGDLDVTFLEGLVDGANAVAREAGCAVLGGDTKENATLTLTGTALGTTPRPLLRSGGRPGDVLVVTGAFGGAAATLDALRRGGGRDVADPLLRPTPRVREGVALREAGATSCMDVSDGLGLTVHALAHGSGCGAVLDVDAVPRHPATAGHPEEVARRWVLGGGGEYELVATLPQAQVEAATAAVPGLTVVGALRAEAGVVTPGGDAVPPLGWQHFQREGRRKDNP